jgi:hypothetical protein
MLAAGYAVYGVSTLLVLASAGGAAVYQVSFFFKIVTEIFPPHNFLTVDILIGRGLFTKKLAFPSCPQKKINE